MARRRKRHVPTLLSVLPRRGFKWRSLYGFRFIIPNQVTREITRAFMKLLPAFDMTNIEVAIKEMFKAAIDSIDGPITSSREEFWGTVKTKVVWLRELEPQIILLFSWAVLSAHHIAFEHYDHELLLAGKSAEDYPMQWTGAAELVADYTSNVIDTQPPEVRKQLMPSWIFDEHNQGDEESTKAAFLKSIENLKKGLTMGGKPPKPEQEGEQDENDDDYGDNDGYDDEDGYDADYDYHGDYDEDEYAYDYDEDKEEYAYDYEVEGESTEMEDEAMKDEDTENKDVEMQDVEM